VPLTFCALSPHPPLLVPEIGGESLERVTASRVALQEMSRHVVERRPDTVVIICPHGPVRIDALSMLAAETFEAWFTGFECRYDLRGDVDMAERIRVAVSAAGYPVFPYKTFDSYRYHFSRGLDHATMVPLYYLKEAGLDAPLVCLSIAGWSHRDHYFVGKAMQEAFAHAPQNVVFIASGDLSHRLIPTAPAGYEPRGIEFDRRVVDAIGRVDSEDVMRLDDDFIDRIGECGLRPIATMLGLLEGREASGRVLAYEGPFGVGYCVAEIDPGGVAAPRPTVQGGLQGLSADAVLHLVRKAVEAHVRGESAARVPDPLPAGLDTRAGAFVCLKIDGELRGCIGTTVPTQTSLAGELLQNAVSAATRDPRFPPVRSEELGRIRYSVDVLEPAEPVASVHDLDPKHYGVIVRSGGRSGVLLPDLAGVDTAQVQVDIARQKAGIRTGEPLELMRFRVRRYTEE